MRELLADDGFLGNGEHVTSWSHEPLSLPNEDVVEYGDGEGVYTDRVESEHVETVESVLGELGA